MCFNGHHFQKLQGWHTVPGIYSALLLKEGSQTFPWTSWAQSYVPEVILFKKSSVKTAEVAQLQNHRLKFRMSLPSAFIWHPCSGYMVVWPPSWAWSVRMAASLHLLYHQMPWPGKSFHIWSLHPPSSNIYPPSLLSATGNECWLYKYLKSWFVGVFFVRKSPVCLEWTLGHACSCPDRSSIFRLYHRMP